MSYSDLPHVEFIVSLLAEYISKALGLCDNVGSLVYKANGIPYQLCVVNTDMRVKILEIIARDIARPK